MLLFRPVGSKELELIKSSNFEKFPERLAEQPIFYPVLNEKYAIEIASKWNKKYNDEKMGYVTKFQINDEYIKKFKVQTVGAPYHQEYWIPAEELDEFNQNIIGTIDVIKEF